jgi:hypothetical protein
MGVILHNVTEGRINFPSVDARLRIEDNVGDQFPVHIHIGPEMNKWKIRIHFTYDEFCRVVKAMQEVGRL